MAAAVQRLADESGSQVSLVGVSAGGWLARLVLGRDQLAYDGEVFSLADCVHTLVTCGTPHLSLEAYPFGRAEEAWLLDLHGLPAGISTSLQYVNHMLPDADSLKPVRVVCLAGNAVRGEQLSVGELAQRVWSGKLPLREANTFALIQSAYMANCGRVEVDGDAVTPVETAALPGAELLVLPDVWHNAGPPKLWYGSREVVEVWDKFLP